MAVKTPNSLLLDQSIDREELLRLTELTSFESNARKNGYRFPVGIDEAGRGPLAGPVAAAACYIPEGIFLAGIDDSKRLTARARERLAEQIQSDPRIISSCVCVSAGIIDEINILQATIRAMLEAVDTLQVAADYLLVDGLQLPHPTVPGEKIIKGDQRSQSIAAASVLAKVHRDRLMLEYAEQWPEYGFEGHKGYGTRKHMEALAKYGPCPIHRMTFAPVARAL